MKSSSIGSPFLNFIRLTNNSQSIATESSSIMTPSAMLAMKEFAPRLFRDHLKQASGLKVTVSMYHSVETSAGFLVKTICSTWDGNKPLIKLIEFVWIEAYQLSLPEQWGLQRMSQNHLVREYLVWTSPVTLRRVQNLKPAPLSDGLQIDLFPG
ncbi:hypothetical protein C8R26_11755 [Nitrosomonas oligotropha]|uniref:Uncharacterized protein n=1 Tax=Nitrosomonas oligotropha TaxID=42354 RepID=A0A2T5HY12_9PROT|nr:hypothetical protein C8R26_11755 [Nitrosomonas oligotropha]